MGSQSLANSPLRAHMHAAWRRLQSQLQPYPPSHPLAGAFRAKQLQAVLRLTPLTVLANLINATLIGVIFWPSADRALLLLWVGAVALVVSQGLRAWRRGLSKPIVSERALKRAVLHATVLALLWAVIPLWLFSSADASEQLLIGVVTTGMICAGGFALATLPMAASAYVLILSAACVLTLAMAAFPMAMVAGLLLACYAVIVLASAWASAHQFNMALISEAEAERQSQVIGLLLRDFEEHASDLLWEIDARGHLCHVSSKLVAALHRPAEQLVARPVIELLDSLQEHLPKDLRHHLNELRESLQGDLPFRDLLLPLAHDGETRWWSLTAKPLLDRHGQRIGWRGVATDITEAQLANDRLTFLAHYDALTGLANRHQLRARLAELLAQRNGTLPAFAVLCLDLDHFKSINDTLGHAVGDGLLQEVSRRLLAGIRQSDVAGRLGGDEFVIVLNDVQSQDEVTLLTRRLLDRLHEPCEVQGAALSMRISIGVAMAPQDGTQIDTLLNHADLALYTAKTEARGDFRFFQPQMATLTRRRLQIEHALRDALPRGQLQLVYQPQISLHHWNVIGFEALLRWNHPELGEVQPAEFIPVAEEAGLILGLGDWVLREACRNASNWPESTTVSVNVSPVQAMSHDLSESIRRLLEELGMPARRLEIEITESIFLNESHATMQGLRMLKDLGLRIALDDFGTGYSSLAYLRRFPFDTLKIDHSFVRELMSRGDARAIVRSIVSLARTLNMNTIAEGVEEAQQLDVLGGYGCGAMQGHFVARPMPASEVPGFLAAWSARARPEAALLRRTDSSPLP